MTTQAAAIDSMSKQKWAHTDPILSKSATINYSFEMLSKQKFEAIPLLILSTYNSKTEIFT